MGNMETNKAPMNTGNIQIVHNNGIQYIRIKVCVEHNILQYKPTRAGNKIIEGHNPSTKEATKSLPATMIYKGNHQGTKGNGRLLPCKLLDEGQGKFLSDMEISDSSGKKKHPPEPTTRADVIGEHAEHVLLRPPSSKLRAKLQQGQQQINCGNKIK